MTRRKAMLPSALLAAAFLAQQCLPALAHRPSTGGIAGSNKLMQGVSEDPNNLSFSPVLLQLAKLVGRIGLAPGYYLQGEGLFTNEPGVDLRTLLRYQSGQLRLPLTPGSKSGSQPEGSVPMLSAPGIPEARPPLAKGQQTGPELPSLAHQALPRDIERDQVISTQRTLGEPGDISIIALRPADGHVRPTADQLVSIDINQLKSDLHQLDQKDPRTTSLVADIPLIAMAMPRTSTMPFITRNMFRLWTWRSELTPPQESGNDSVPEASFNGTFVVATTGAIKSITGRHFTMGPGRLLANNQGGELLFQTPLGSVSVEPGATAAIELIPSATETTVRVYAIESSEQNAVTLTLPSGKQKTMRLDPGEAVILADHAVSPSDLEHSYISSTTKFGANILRGKFPVSQYVQQELMLKSQGAGEQYQTLASLKKRLNSAR